MKDPTIRRIITALLPALLAVNGSHSVYAADDATTKKSIATLDRAELVIDMDTIFEVNGQSAIPGGLFGVTAYNGFGWLLSYVVNSMQRLKDET